MSHGFESNRRIGGEEDDVEVDIVVVVVVVEVEEVVN